jgi:hypothetical protein
MPGAAAPCTAQHRVGAEYAAHINLGPDLPRSMLSRRTRKMPTTSPIWRSEALCLAHSSFAMMVSSAEAVGTITPRIVCSTRRASSSRENARSLRITRSTFHVLRMSMMLHIARRWSASRAVSGST